MQDYKTVEEKAIEWNLTPRHIQYLCRMGKVESAIKRAGVWFIPDSVPIPAKNTKAGVKGFKFVGTKQRIFDCAIDLFMLKGFDNVSLKDVAKKAGIRQSTIYNHFKSKQELLDTIYDFYYHYFLEGRLSMEDMEPKLQDESFMDIIEHIRYEFKEEYRQKMNDITKIILQRIAMDDQAKEIAKSLVVKEGIKYVEDVFNRAVVIGRFAPFDTHAMAVFINGIRMFTLYNWIVDPLPDNMMKIVEDEKGLYQYAARYITDLKLSG